MNALDNLVIIASAIAFIALPFLLVNWFKYIKSLNENKTRFSPVPLKMPVKSVAFFVAPLIVAIVSAEIVRERSRDEALHFLNDLPENYQVFVNSQQAQDPNSLVSALKGTAPQSAHHSHPTTRISIDIQSAKGSLTLQLGRDSGYEQEYWVFYPKYRVTSNTEIGRITTPLFDDY